MTMTGVQRITPEEFRAMPEGPPFYEYEEGELIMAASPTPEHQDVVIELGHTLRQFVRQGQMGRVFMNLSH